MPPFDNIILAEQYRNQNTEAAFRRAKQEIARYENLAQLQGEELPDQPSEGILSKTFDLLDTGGQFVRGVLAKGIGDPNYRDLDLLDAGIKGVRDDIIVSDLLQKTGTPIASFLNLDPYSGFSKAERAVEGFVGDVLTDPLTYLTFGGGAAKRLGGKSASNKALKLSDEGIEAAFKTGVKTYAPDLATADDLYRIQQKSILNEKLLDIQKRFSKGILNADDMKRAQTIAEAESAVAAEEPFKLVRSILDQKKKGVKDGSIELLKSAGDLDPYLLGYKSNLVTSKFGLDEAVNLEDLFLKPAIRFNAPFSAGDKFARLFGISDDVGNIPGITSGSEVVFEQVGDLLYNASVDVTKAFNAVIETGKGIPGLDVPSKIIESIVKFPFIVSKNAGKLLSRRISAGGAAKLEKIQEHEAQRAFLLADVSEEANQIFTRASGELFGDDAYQSAVDVIEEVVKRQRSYADEFASATKLKGIEDDILSKWKEAAEKGASPEQLNKIYESIPAAKARLKRQANKAAVEAIAPEPIINQGINRVREIFNAKEAGYGDEVSNLISRVNDDFKRMADIEVEEGILSEALNGYIPHAYVAREGIDKELAIKNFAKQFDSFTEQGLPSFTLQRTFETYDDAIAAGLRPVRDLRTLWVMRTYQHKRALAAKKFWERMSLQEALPTSTKRAFEKLLMSKATGDAQRAQQLLKSRGIQLNIDDVLSAAPESQFLKTREVIGDAIDKTPDRVWGLLRHPDSGIIVTPEQYENYRRLVSSTANTPAVVKAKSVVERLGLTFEPREAEDLKLLYENYLQARAPLLGRLGEEITDRVGVEILPEKFRSLIQKTTKAIDPETKRFYEGVLPTPLVNVISESLDTRGSLQRFIDFQKRAGIQDPMNSAATKVLGGYLSWVKWLKYGATQLFPAYHLRNLVSAQIQQTKAASILGDSLNPFALLKTHKILNGADLITEAGERISHKQLLSEMSLLGVRVNRFAASDVMDSWGDALRAYGANTGVIDPDKVSLLRKTGEFVKSNLFEKLGKGSEWIENIGRQNLYIALRRRGYGAGSAASLTNKTLIDYARGKTPFERNFLNNIIFFYSFARGEAANTATAMLTKPGSLTTQLHFVNGVAEILEDESATEIPPDLEGIINTHRSRQTISRVLGQNAEGDFKILSNAGIPAEDLVRFIDVQTPKTFNPGDVISAGLDTVQRSAQSILASVNPIIRRPIEYAFNRQLYFDRSLSDSTLRKVPTIADSVMRVLPYDPSSVPGHIFESLDETTKKLLRGRDNGDGTMTIDKHAIIAMSFFPMLDRLNSTALAAFKNDVEPFEKGLRLFTGVKANDVNLQESLAFDRAKQLRDYFENEGLPTSRKRYLQTQALLGEK